jgi:hypothetical protein
VKIVVLILKLIDEKIVEMDKDSFVVRMGRKNEFG